MKPAHQALREGTRAEHERLDALMTGFDLATRDSYRRFLRAHAEALAPVEAALDAAADLVIADWPARRRLAQLQADLETLRHPGESRDLTLDFDPARDPSLRWGDDGQAAAAGALYVVEGSRLGGRFLVKQVGTGLPTAYLGDVQPAGRWPALLAALDRALPDDDARARAVASARTVFARFEAAARRQLDPRLCGG